MVFNEGVFFAAFGIWILVVTGWVVYREMQLRRFLGSAKAGDVRRLLDNVLKDLGKNQDALVKISHVLQNIRKRDVFHIQKLGLVKFNPFRDAGGNQSFAFALLNEENTGIVLTGLHARDTTRIYIKDVVRGSSRSELSKEEKQAIEMAIGKR